MSPKSNSPLPALRLRLFGLLLQIAFQMVVVPIEDALVVVLHFLDGRSRHAVAVVRALLSQATSLFIFDLVNLDEAWREMVKVIVRGYKPCVGEKNCGGDPQIVFAHRDALCF